MLRAACRRAVPEADVRAIATDSELDALAPEASLLLVNRVLDGEFSDRHGLDLLRRRPNATWLLISRYPDAQAEARRLGALEGFDKTQLYEPRTAEIIRGACSKSRNAHP